MKMNKSRLSDKIRIVLNPKKLMNCPERRLKFYVGYASKVYKNLKQPVFQRFINWIIKREKIDRQAVKEIQVRIFPSKKENGKSLAGRCNTVDGTIIIFPKKHSFFHNKIQNHKKKKVHFYLKSRAMASLIHEVLHMKYEGNETKVRKLTKKYFDIFIRHQNPEAPKIYNIQKMLFAL
jgi:hypothetical protein